MKNIMIKTAIATAVVAATTVTTIADTSVYGRLRMVAVCTDPGGAADNDCGLENRSSRFGIKASSEITDGLTAFGRYEFGVDADNGVLGKSASTPGQQTNRLAYVGLKGGFGEVSIGARWSPYYNHTISPVDPTNAFGGTWNSGAGYITDFRNSDTINYKNKFGAASFGLQLQMSDDDLGSDAIDEVSAGMSFKAGSATLGLGYLDTKDVGSVVALHARSKLGPVSVAGTYQIADADVGADADAIAVAVGYGMGGGSSITGTYGVTMNDGGADPTELGIEYVKNMGAGFKWFAGFSVADDDIAGSDDTNRYGAGMRYDF